MCLSAIGSGISNPTLNRAKNSNTPVTSISNYLGMCELQNFGLNGSEYCADQCCFDIEDQNHVHAIVLHECETGKIIDFQCPPQGMTCPDGQVCIDMTCWAVPGSCPVDGPEIDLACMDPCKLWHTLRQARLQMLAEKCTVSWRNGSKAGSYRPQDYDELMCEETIAKQMCLECGQSQSCVLTDLPGCF